MSCLRVCNKCGTLHLVGGVCSKPLTEKEVKEWAEKKIRDIQEYQNRTVNINVGRYL